jgi:Spy/CpxP family protein refolding chaperone
MRKKLALLVFALAALAASSVSHAAPSTCPPRTYPINCGDHILCCPINALCFCG